MRAAAALELALQLPDIHRVLDIGCGAGEHAARFRAAGRSVTTIDMAAPADYVGDFVEIEPGEPAYDLVWASHVLEHQRNVGAFLDHCRHLMAPGGWLAVTVPPMKDEVVGGHVGLFNAGVLLYHLVLAGFDCRHAKVRSEGYDVSVVVRYERASLPWLAHDAGDIERLAPFFPLPVKQAFDGRIRELNWSI